MATKTYHHGNLQAEILDTAVKSAAKHGPQGISIREIARELDVSAPAIYRHYDGQDALLLAVKVAILERMAEYMEAESAKLQYFKGSELERTLEHLRAIGRGYVRFGLDQPGLFRTAYAPSSNPDKAGGEQLLEIMSKPCLYLQSILEGLASLGYIRHKDVEPYSFMLWSVTHGFTLLLVDKQIIPKGDAELHSLIDTIIDTNLAGMNSERELLQTTKQVE